MALSAKGTVVTAATLVAVAWGVGVLSALTIHDVPPQYDLVNRPGIGVTAGDLHSVSADGLHSRPLCALTLREGAVDAVEVDRVYSNIIADWIPLLGRVSEGLTGPEGATSGHDIHFVGRFTALAEFPVSNPAPDCVAMMVDRVLLREKLCFVNMSLTSERNPAYSAYAYEQVQMWLPASVFEEQGREMPDWMAGHMATPCPQGPREPWPVLVRKLLGIVVERAPGEVRVSGAAALSY